MKRIQLTIGFILSCFIGIAQNYDSTPPYLKTKEIPSFNILQADSSWFRNKDLPKNKPTVIVYFSPDCGHCQETARDFAKEINDFSNATFLWVTYLAPLDEIEQFKKEYKLDGHSNIHFGKDPQYFIPAFFRVEQTPFVALYNKKGKLVKAWPMFFNTKELKKSLLK